jgi:hypothetical protein
MTKENAIVDGIRTISPTVKSKAMGADGLPSRFVEVIFESGRSGLLETAIPRSAIWSEVLNSLKNANQPAYVEIDPETNIVTELLCPLTVKVESLTEAADHIEVELIISHARHYLRRDNPDFQELLDALQAAKEQRTMVVVTETPERHEIIDVRPLPRTRAFAELIAPPTAAPEPRLIPITPTKAQELFNLVNTKMCCPASPKAPCIPFLYPDDGCWGRAHEMCRLMIANGTQPEKVWIYGNLHTPTPNNPACAVNWGWHVAPILHVKTAATTTETWVIDPSMFPGPVSENTWSGAQGDPSALLVHSIASVFYRSRSGSVQYDDAAYTQTKQVLDTYRNQLKLRSASSYGPPPYLNCLTKPAGVQFFGTLGAGASSSWYTWGWPVSWHVIWTIMPITFCPGWAQLSWNVQVERANASQCTYWITVKNLTSDPVRFECRYDILSK